MTARVLAGWLAIALLTATSLGAQRSPVRAGNTLDVGVGGGLAGVRCESCIPSDASAASGFVKVGRVVAPNVIASLEWTRWSRPQFGQQARFDFVTAGAQVYLVSGLDLWMRYAIGYGRASYVQMVFEPQTYRTERSGFAQNASLGYDMRVSDRVVLAPFVMVSSIRKGSARVDGQAAPYDVSAGLMQYGISLGLR
jgi:hypothetical protein